MANFHGYCVHVGVGEGGRVLRPFGSMSVPLRYMKFQLRTRSLPQFCHLERCVRKVTTRQLIDKE